MENKFELGDLVGFCGIHGYIKAIKNTKAIITTKKSLYKCDFKDIKLIKSAKHNT